MHDLKKYYKHVQGNIMPAEAFFLHGVIKMIDPKVVLEFGTLTCYSSANFLNAMNKNARLYSFDINRKPEVNMLSEDKRFIFVQSDQSHFDPSIIKERKVDFLFIDASHNLQANINTFQRVNFLLNRKSIIAIHDTDKLARQPDEVKFASWLSRFCNRIDFHDINGRKYGISMFQKNNKKNISVKII
jgi:predicted O-methyltransferase YrrM